MRRRIEQATAAPGELRELTGPHAEGDVILLPKDPMGLTVGDVEALGLSGATVLDIIAGEALTRQPTLYRALTLRALLVLVDHSAPARRH